MRKHFDGSYEGPLVRQYTTSRNRVIPQHCIPSDRLTYIVHKLVFLPALVLFLFLSPEVQCCFIVVSELKHELFVKCQKILAFFSCKLIEKDVLQREIMRKLFVLIYLLNIASGVNRIYRILTLMNCSILIIFINTVNYF